jgi:GT2 family glycosyltransferase
MKNKNFYKFVYLVLNYNSEEETIKFIDSVFKNSCDFFIILIDNNSKNIDSLIEFINNKKEFIHLIKQKENVGYSKGMNAGFIYAKENFDYKFLVLSNSDIQLVSKNFNDMVENDYNKYKFAVLGPDVLPKHSNPLNSFLDSNKKISKEIRKMKRANFFIGIPLFNYLYLIFIKIFNRHSSNDYKNLSNKAYVDLAFVIFSEEYTLNGLPGLPFMYNECNFLNLVCIKNNFKILYDPELKVLHEESASTKKINNTIIKRKKFYYKENIKSLLIYKEFFEKNKDNN